MFWLWTIGAGVVGYLIGSRKNMNQSQVGLDTSRPRESKLLSSSSMTPVVSEGSGRAIVRASPGVYLRTQPGGEIVDELVRGEVVDVIASSNASGSWWQVRSPRGTVGYALGINSGGEQNLMFLPSAASQMMLPASYVQAPSRSVYRW